MEATRVDERHWDPPLFLLTKQRKYFFDPDSIRAPLVHPEAAVKGAVVVGANKGWHTRFGTTAHRWGQSTHGKRRDIGPRGKNPGDVWSVSARLTRETHVDAVPIEIPLRCIAAGSPKGEVVLDPFSGAATTGLTARRLGRVYRHRPRPRVA
ncbi:DNA methyltransferase [Amycolatopsis sp. NPDC004079]|uniref:DNA methyltransferase n=1 Tax=Amycolatopsis sp. NPDC004079 TaxID=3154549 RepID=UPI0033AE1361